MENKILEKTYDLANEIKDSKEYKRLLELDKLIKTDSELISLIESFNNVKLKYDEVTKYGKYHPDLKRVQLELAKKYKLPIIIHVRDSFDEVFNVVDAHNDESLTGIFHCFTGGSHQAQRIIEYGGFKLGIGGVITFKNSGLGETIEKIPLDNLVLETDSPYLAPTPHRGKRNESSYLPLIAKKIAELHDVSIETVAKITTQNANEVFKLMS